MKKKDFLKKKVKPVNVRKSTVNELVLQMNETGFQGKSLAEAVNIIEKMIKENDNTIFLGYSGSMSTAGQWKIIKWLIENNLVDCIVSTGANVSEDVFEAMGFNYFQGTHLADDSELLKNNIDRFYDVYANEFDYRKMESLIVEFMDSLEDKRPYSSAEFLFLFGKFQAEKKIDSITASAFKNKIPVFSPALADSAYGVAAFLSRKKGKKIILDQFKDFEQLGEIACNSEKTSVIYIGGGVPKDTIQLTTILSHLSDSRKDSSHKYAVQITSDSPQWGGLSGCTLEEAVSWGKIHKDALKTTCYSDATISLPIIASALSERIRGKRKKKNLEFVFREI